MVFIYFLFLNNFKKKRTISRVMLCIINLNTEYLNSVKNHLVSRQQQNNRERLSLEFDKLMKDVILGDLTYSNRDTFTTHLHVFVNEVRQYISD